MKKQNNSVQIIRHSLKRNKVMIIILILAIVAGLVIGSYAGVQAYYNGWLG